MYADILQQKRMVIRMIDINLKERIKSPNIAKIKRTRLPNIAVVFATRFFS